MRYLLAEWMVLVHDLHKVSQQFKDVSDKIKDLEPRLARFKQSVTTTATDGDPGETGRRNELTRYVHKSPPSPASPNVLRSALEQIEKRSQALLEKNPAARFVDKGGDSGEVVKLIERLQEAITHYQVSSHMDVAPNAADVEEQISQQQAIYDKITDLTVSAFSSFRRLLYRLILLSSRLSARF